MTVEIQIIEGVVDIHCYRGIGKHTCTLDSYPKGQKINRINIENVDNLFLEVPDMMMTKNLNKDSSLETGRYSHSNKARCQISKFHYSPEARLSDSIEIACIGEKTIRKRTRGD